VRALAVVAGALLVAAATAGCALAPDKPQRAERDCKPTAKTLSYRAVVCDGVQLGDRCFTWIIGMECDL
jgi:hypothetical protein